MMDANSTLRINAYTEVQEERDVARRAQFPESVLLAQADPSETAGVSHNPLLPRGVFPASGDLEPVPTRPGFSSEIDFYRRLSGGDQADVHERVTLESMLSAHAAHGEAHISFAHAAAAEEATSTWARPVYEPTVVLPVATETAVAEEAEPLIQKYASAAEPLAFTPDETTGVDVHVDVEEPTSEEAWLGRSQAASGEALAERRSGLGWNVWLAVAFSGALGVAAVLVMSHFGLAA